jgi:hypothetical protein
MPGLISVLQGRLENTSLSGISGGCVHAGRAGDDQLIGGVELTVVVRWVPGLPVRCGTRVARPAGDESGSDLDGARRARAYNRCRSLQCARNCDAVKHSCSSGSAAAAVVVTVQAWGLRRPVGADRGAGGGRPGELATGSRVVSLERDPLRGDGELPDLGLVQAGSGLQHGQGASHLRLVA